MPLIIVTLTIILLILKLIGIITWPWLWVLSPAWVPVFGLLILIVCAIIAERT